MDMMVAVDLSHEPDALMGRVLPWSTRFSGRLHLRVVSRGVYDAGGDFGGLHDPSLALRLAQHQQGEREALDELVKRLPSDRVASAEVLAGEVGPSLVRAADYVDLIVLGTHGRKGLERVFLGSVAERLVRKANVPVMVLPLTAEPIPTSGTLTAMCPVDARDVDLLALQRLQAWHGDNVEPHLVYVLPDLRLSREMGFVRQPVEAPTEHPLLPWAEARIRRAMDEAGCASTPLHFVLSEDSHPAYELAKFGEAQAVDLVAMPTHGRTGWSRFAFGSVTEQLVRIMPTSCLVVR
ncbi:MAG: universal stress protein [Myxococcota bacterium]